MMQDMLLRVIAILASIVAFWDSSKVGAATDGWTSSELVLWRIHHLCRLKKD